MWSSRSLSWVLAYSIFCILYSIFHILYSIFHIPYSIFHILTEAGSFQDYALTINVTLHSPWCSCTHSLLCCVCRMPCCSLPCKTIQAVLQSPRSSTRAMSLRSTKLLLLSLLSLGSSPWPPSAARVTTPKCPGGSRFIRVLSS